MAERPNGAWLCWVCVVAWCCPIVTTLPAAASQSQAKARNVATEIFHCAFDSSWDVNYDAWPDRWARREGTQYPHYVRIEIGDSGDPTRQQALSIALDGAGAAVTSPAIGVMPRFMYRLEAQLRTQNIVDTRVVLTADFLDAEGRLVEHYESEPVQTHGKWADVSVGPVSLKGSQIDRVVLGVQATPQRLSDLDGVVWLDDVRFARLPRMIVRTNDPFNVYSKKEEPVVICELSGIQERDPEIRFQLYDEMSRPLDGYQDRLDGRLIVEDKKRASDIVHGGGGPAGYEGRMEWRPPLPDYGYYRIVVRMLSCDPACGDSDAERELYREEITVAAIPPLLSPPEGEFGWTLPQADWPHSFGMLTQLLPKVGVNRIKFPAWYDPKDDRRGDEIVQFAELLGASNIDVVGMIVKPPPGSDAYEHFDDSQSIANLFLHVDPAYWQPSLDPVMTRLALRVRWWQLGGDRDRGFAETPQIQDRMTALQPLLFRFGQEVSLGIGWPWDGEPPPAGRVAWEFEVHSAKSALDAAQLTGFLSDPQPNSAERWVLIDPPGRRPQAENSPAVELHRRVRELLDQIVVAKQHAAQAIIYPEPFHDEHGLMRADGSPDELLLPWRTAVCMLSAAEYLGQLQLPQGSNNRVFLRPDGQVVMVVWNDRTTEEVLYLGEEIRQIDCWGRESRPAVEEHNHRIPVGPLPSYVLGLNEGVTRWRMAFKFDQLEVPSIFRTPHANRMHLKNTFRQGVGGKYSIVVAPKERSASQESTLGGPRTGAFNSSWSVFPARGEFTIPAGDSAEFPLEIVLKGATYGEQPIRVDFEVDAEQTYVFSVFRTMHVGLGEITVNLDSHLDENGTLVVEQRMANTGNQLVDFNCYLYADGYRRQRVQVYRLSKEENLKRYLFPNGATLVGTELLLEAVEVDGSRILKYEFTVKQ